MLELKAQVVRRVNDEQQVLGMPTPFVNGNGLNKVVECGVDVRVVL